MEIRLIHHSSETESLEISTSRLSISEELLDVYAYVYELNEFQLA